MSDAWLVFDPAIAAAAGRLQHALADRPNPIGVHRVRVHAVDGARVRVGPLEAVHGTPIVDVKPVLSADVTER